MKKLLAVILSIVLLLPALALADLPDLAAMSDQELKDLITACSQELRTRATSEPDGILLFDAGGMRVYQIGDAYISKSGRLKIPAIIYNDLDVKASFSIDDATLNDFAVFGYCYSQLPPHSKVKDELDFSSEDAELKSVDDIYSLIFGWHVLSWEDYSILYQSEGREEHRFW